MPRVGWAAASRSIRVARACVAGRNRLARVPQRSTRQLKCSVTTIRRAGGASFRDGLDDVASASAVLGAVAEDDQERSRCAAGVAKGVADRLVDPCGLVGEGDKELGCGVFVGRAEHAVRDFEDGAGDDEVVRRVGVCGRTQVLPVLCATTEEQLTRGCCQRSKSNWATSTTATQQPVRYAKFPSVSLSLLGRLARRGATASSMTAEGARPMAEPPGLSAMRLLPRSLDPLEDESLPGFLLRLSYRLSIGPGPLVLHTGLPSSRKDRTTLIRIPLSCAVSLSEPDIAAFCRSTRLSRQETAGLLLPSLGSRYGPLNPNYRGRNVYRSRDTFSTGRLHHNNPWVLTTRTQYCPDCLAGDGSEIQQHLGGAWRRLWWLPPVFCCPRHERFLRRHCHHCGEPAQNRHSNDLIARPRDSELHPLQCRATPQPGKLRAVSPACGADLIQAPRDSEPTLKDPRSRDALFALQRKYLSFLSPDGPGQVSSVGWITPTPQYFQDLRGVVALIFMTWPEARPHSATSELAQVIDVEAERRRLAPRPPTPSPRCTRPRSAV